MQHAHMVLAPTAVLEGIKASLKLCRFTSKRWPNHNFNQDLYSYHACWYWIGLPSERKDNKRQTFNVVTETTETHIIPITQLADSNGWSTAHAEPRLSGLCSICCASTDKPNDGKTLSRPREPLVTMAASILFRAIGWKNEVQGGTKSLTTSNQPKTSCKHH